MHALLLVAALLGGTIQIEKQAWVNTTGLAAATAINSAAWTGWIPVDSKRSVVLEVTYVNSAGSAVVLTCETSNNASTTNGSGFELHVLSDSGTVGTSTSTAHSWSNAVAGSELWTWTIANLPHDYINCSFVATGGDGNDTAAVRYRGVSP